MSSRSFQFTHAVTRRPGQDIASGLRAVDTGAPDLAAFLGHHAAYVEALKAAGAQVIELDPLEGYPDAVFVEDTALCLPEGAIIMRPGAPSRLGEAAAMAPVLARLYGEVACIGAPGFVEGGDILTTECEILVGRSARTDATGVAALAAIVAEWGYRLREVAVPDGVLHFKTDCSLLDAETILATPRLAASGCFEGYEVVHTAEGEEAAANSIRFNDSVLMAAGFRRTRDTLTDRGYAVIEIGNTEAAKLDGGMSCLSLRFTPG